MAITLVMTLVGKIDVDTILRILAKSPNFAKTNFKKKPPVHGLVCFALSGQLNGSCALNPRAAASTPYPGLGLVPLRGGIV